LKIKTEISAFNLEYSEYIKTEFDYIKHWDLKEKVFAVEPFWNSNLWQL
jgi:hypothetical protein